MKKVCLSCGKEFKTDNKHSYQNYCSSYCNKKYYRKKHKEEIKEKKAEYYQLLKKRDLEELRARGRINRKKYYKIHKDLEQSKSRERYRSPKGQIYYKNWYQQNKTIVNKRSKNWARENPEKIKGIRIKSYDKHAPPRIKYTLERRKQPEIRKKYRSYAKKYQKKKRGYDSQLTPNQEECIRKRDDNKCVYCLKESSLTFDHIIPQSQEGKDIIKNVVLACNNHNSSKRHANIFEWCKRKKIKVPKIIIKLLKEQKNQNLIPKNEYGQRIKTDLNN